MSQHDQNIANDSGAAVRSDINSALAALFGRSSGASAPSTTIAYQPWADTTNGLLKRRNAANTSWLVEGTLAETFLLARSSNTILGVADWGRTIHATASYTQTLSAVATLADGWEVDYIIDAGATVTFDPNSSETIDGSTTLAVQGPASLTIKCNGSALFTKSKVEIASQSDMESGTSTSRFVTPGRQHYHQSAAKAWCNGNFAGTIGASYNVTSLTDNGTGDVTVNLTNAFSSVNFAVVVSSEVSSFAAAERVFSVTASSVRLQFYGSTTGTLADPTEFHMVAFGDQ